MRKNIRPVVFILAVCGACLFIISCLNLRILTEKYDAEKRALQQEQVSVLNESSLLNMIDTYQHKYFDIVTRNDVLLLNERNDDIKNDEKQLAELFDEVKSKINPENPFLLKYNDISEKYSGNNGENTYEMNQFAQDKYNAIDGLLNDVYQAVMSTLTDEEASALRDSESKWLKQMEDYNNYFEQKDYGTIAYLVKSGYECNMRSFRTLLLMLYLNN